MGLAMVTKDDHWYECLRIAARNWEADFIQEMVFYHYPEIVWC